MNETEIIDLRENFDMIKKRIWLIVLITIVAIITSGIISYFILEPIYETSTTLMVGKTKEQESRIEYNDVLLSQKLVKTYGEIAKSTTVSKEVVKNLKLELTPEQLKEKVTVSAVGDTEIIRITVQDANPATAVKIANNLAMVFMDYVQKIMKVDNVQVIDTAEVPINPIKPRPLINIMIAGFVGLMMGLGIAFLLEYLDNTIKTPSDVEKYLQLPVIGTIPMAEDKHGGKA